MRTLLHAITLVCVLAAPVRAAVIPPKAAPRSAPGSSGARKEVVVPLILSSPAFRQLGEIPRRHTCDGEDVSPPLAWGGAPPGTKSLALVVDDPDAPDPAAPKLVWVHWLLYDLPASASSLAEGLPAAHLPPGTREGLNDWKRTGWRGPCPPVGRHRYFHKLYALDIVLPDLHHPTRAALEKAMEGHVIARAELVGTYQRPR